MKKGKKLMAALLSMTIVVGSIGSNIAYAASQTSEFGLETAYNIAAEGAVLLKNDDGALPLEKESKINVFGNAQLDTWLGGGGSGSSSIDNPVYMLEALKNEGFQVNDELASVYSDYWTTEGKNEENTYYVSLDATGLGQAFGNNAIAYREMAINDDVLNQAKDYSETAVVILARGGSEGVDLGPDDVSLYEEEEELIETVATNFSNVIVLFNTNTLLEMGFLEDYENIKAAIQMWAPGTRGCEAIADILSGDVNPSGKLADTAAYSIWDYPSTQNMGEFAYDDGIQYLEYEEDIYVGYRYFETFEEDVMYEFGYGLSYTTFDVKTVGFSADAETITTQVRVTNTGDVAGKEVVQIYYQSAGTELERASRELAAYEKTDLLQPGQSQTITLTFDTRDMAGYSEDREAYILEEGEQTIYAGTSVKQVEMAGAYDNPDLVIYKDDDTTGTEITNLFEHAYGSSLTTLSQEDPDATYPTMPDKETSRANPFSDDAVVQTNTTGTAETKTLEAETFETESDETLTLSDVYYDESLWDAFLSQWSKEELITYVMNGEFRTNIMDEYGVPGFDMKDGPANIRAGNGGWGGDSGTSFPVTVMIACTWSKQLANDYGTSIGIEGTNMGTEAWYAPAVNIHRNPLCGRNFEYYSEDPILSGTMSAETVKGAQEQGVQVTLKHFAANNQEWGRAGLRTIVSERALREIYLKSFEIPVKAGANGIMGAFNFLGNVWCNADTALMTDLLRTEWGFDGYVITDAYQDISTTDYRAWDDAAQMMYAGTDLFLSSYPSRNNKYEAEYQELSDEYDNVPEFRAVLEENVKHTLQVIMKTYAFSDIIGTTDNVNYVAPEESWFNTAKSDPVTYRTIAVVADDSVTVNLIQNTVVAGEEVTFSVDVSDTTKQIDRVTVYGESGTYTRVLIANNGVYTFTMPEDNVTIKVGLKDAEVLNTNSLEYIISIADNYIANGDLDDVIASAKEEFYTAYNNAKDVLAKAQAAPAEATQTEINEAAVELLATFQYLELKTDKEMLQMLISLADSILDNTDDYIPNSISGLQTVVNEAKVVEADGDATNTEINQIVIKLIDEIDKARLRPDKTALTNLIAQMSALDSNLYTADSYALLLTSVEAGEAVVNDDNADADDVNDAVLAIQKAYADLEKLSTSGDNSGSSDPGSNSESSETSTTGSNSTTSQSGKGVKTSPKTGDTMPGFIAILVVGFGTILAIKKRKVYK